MTDFDDAGKDQESVNIQGEYESIHKWEDVYLKVCKDNLYKGPGHCCISYKGVIYKSENNEQPVEITRPLDEEAAEYAYKMGPNISRTQINEILLNYAKKQEVREMIAMKRELRCRHNYINGVCEFCDKYIEDYKAISLFKYGAFTSHSGLHLPDKIDCDALTKDDWDTLAAWVARCVGFGKVVGIETGGSKFAEALQQHCSPFGPVLIVDDVLTTGKSMEEMRQKFNPCETVYGAVVFSRTKDIPKWIIARFVESNEIEDGGSNG